MFCTSFVCSYYLRHTLNFSGKVYVMGMEGLAQDLALQGIDSIGPGPDEFRGTREDLLKTPLDPDVRVGGSCGSVPMVCVKCGYFHWCIVSVECVDFTSAHMCERIIRCILSISLAFLFF